MQAPDAQPTLTDRAMCNEAAQNILSPAALLHEDESNVILWLQREYSKVMRREICLKQAEYMPRHAGVNRCHGNDANSAAVVGASNSRKWSDRVEDDSG